MISVPAWCDWRQDIHAHPETAFEEHRTAQCGGRCVEWNAASPIHRGLGGTGVVGTLKNGEGPTHRAAGRYGCAGSPGTRRPHGYKSQPCRQDARLRSRRPHHRCCSAPPCTWRVTGRSAAPSSSFSSQPRRMKAAAARWWMRACSTSSSRLTRSTACTTFPNIPRGKVRDQDWYRDGLPRYLRDRR